MDVEASPPGLVARKVRVVRKKMRRRREAMVEAEEGAVATVGTDPATFVAAVHAVAMTKRVDPLSLEMTAATRPTVRAPVVVDVVAVDTAVGPVDAVSVVDSVEGSAVVSVALLVVDSVEHPVAVRVVRAVARVAAVAVDVEAHVLAEPRQEKATLKPNHHTSPVRGPCQRTRTRLLKTIVLMKL